MYFSAFFSTYWLVSIFIFLFKRSLYSSFTTVIQRFWKRSLYLFWFVEFYLFSIYLFLVLSCPCELEWMFDQPQLFKSKYFLGGPFFKYILLLVLLIAMSSFLQNAIIFLNNSFNYIVLAVMLYIINIVAFTEFGQVYFLSLYYNGVKWIYDFENYIWDLVTDVEKSRTSLHFNYLLVVLKFWHTIFIVGMFIISVMFFLQQKQISQGGLSANKQNFFFLMFFGFVMYYWVYKFYMNYSYEYVYRWFYVNKFMSPNYTNLFDPLLSLK